MAFWIILPITLFSVSFIGTWTVYAMALSFNHICALNHWDYRNSCSTNESVFCCKASNVPTISSSGTNFPENSLFSATITAGAFLFLVFAIFQHAHILDRNSTHSMLSKMALVFGCVAAAGAFVAGNCNPREVELPHFLGAAVSFVCLCFYSTLLTSLTSRCALTGWESLLYPARVVSSSLQVCVTILYCILYVQTDYYYKHIGAIFEWLLSINMELYELSFIVEFYYFSSAMLSSLLGRREEEKPLILS